MSGFLVLEDGFVFRGRSVGAPGVARGEAVFTTSMSGYQEAVTDPSYAEQLVTFTAPMVGNYGVAPSRSQSPRAHARAVLMRRSTGEEWANWLTRQGVVALDEIDTRSLVLRLRERGSLRAGAVAGSASVETVLAAVREEATMEGRALVAGVSTRKPYRLGRGIPVAVLDYGCKRSILTRLAASGAQALVFPHDTDVDTILSSHAAGVLLSNGP